MIYDVDILEDGNLLIQVGDRKAAERLAEELRQVFSQAAEDGQDSAQTTLDREHARENEPAAETTLERIRRERIAAQERADRTAIEDYANWKRSVLETERAEEERTMNSRHAMESEALSAHLEWQYGAAQRQESAETREIAARLGRGGLFYRLSGREERDRQRVRELHLNREERERGIAEARETLLARFADEREAMTNRYEARHATLEQRVREWREHAREGPEREHARENEPAAETTLERIRRERIEAWERERQGGRDFDFEL